MVDLWGDEDEAYHTFAILEAVEWKWTPSQIREQPEALLHDVLEVGGLNQKIKKIEDDLRQGKI